MSTVNLYLSITPEPTEKYLKGQFFINFCKEFIDALALMEVDQILIYQKGEVELRQLQRGIVKFFQSRPEYISRGYTLKPTPTGHKIWRWK